jgi:Flp pilus assembly protein TadB
VGQELKKHDNVLRFLGLMALVFLAIIVVSFVINSLPSALVSILILAAIAAFIWKRAGLGN